MNRIPFGASELTTDADTGTYGVIIWLGTRSEKKANSMAPDLVPFPAELGNLKNSRKRDRLLRKEMSEERKGKP